MRASDRSFIVRQQPPDSVPMPGRHARDYGMGGAALLDALEIESLMFNLDASLRVHTQPQFFGWTQGILQSLVRHEVLICAHRSGEPLNFQAEVFATPLVEPSVVGGIFRQDASIVLHVAQMWEDGHFRPFALDMDAEAPLAGSSLAAEMQRIGAQCLLVHGIYDTFGKPSSLFMFACRPEDVGPGHARFVELIVPFLHLAWTRTRINLPREAGGAARKSAEILTMREQEILHWIHVGKSNIEIGIILQISPLTVKNHVQKILRKLNVLNRTQAVGKALALRILNI